MIINKEIGGGGIMTTNKQTNKKEELQRTKQQIRKRYRQGQEGIS